MNRNKTFFFITMLVLVLPSCINRFDPVIKSSDAVKYVVSGGVYKGDTIQHINISTSSPVSSPKYFPVAGCTVKVIDGKGISYLAKDKMNGDYEVVIPENELFPGATFKVDILVPGGVNIVSDFDQIYECPDMGSLYYNLDSIPANSSYIVTRGIQFYTDLNAENSISRYFKWDAIETWQYQAAYPIEWWYDGVIHREVPPNLSRKVCWKTQYVNNIFNLTTKNLAVNKYNKYPLQFVDNVSSPRLVYGYSLLVRQFAISEKGYNYSEKLKINSNDQGGLYEKQPLVVKGNLLNITHPEQEVLGYFGAGSVKSKRIFVKKVEGLPDEYEPGCTLEGEEPRRSGVKGIPVTFYPAYLYATTNSFMVVLLDKYCYDCTVNGGKTQKPSFWPEK